MRLGLSADQLQGGRDASASRQEAVRNIGLTDGGVYDNLGLEPVVKRCARILVSDGGGHVGHPARIPGDWLRHLVRVTSLIDHQVRSLRKRMLVEGYREGDFTGAYWGIRTDLADYGPAAAAAFPAERARRLAALPTRLNGLGPDLDDLLEWGRTACDTAVRRWVLP